MRLPWEMTVRQLADLRYGQFSKDAADLYPDVRYSPEYCYELAELEHDLYARDPEGNTIIAAHYYQRPEIQEVAKVRGFVGDSLGIALKACNLSRTGQRRVDAVWLCAVRFMGDTTKIVLGDDIPVYMPNHAGCSLVASIHGIGFDWRRDSERDISRRLLDSLPDHPVARWLEQHPGGIVLSYMNSDPESKALSWSVFTSRNATRVLKAAMTANPGKSVLIMPDTFLAGYMITKAMRDPDNGWFDSHLVETLPREPVRGLCHVHADKIGSLALDEALKRYPEADVYVHPECGCAVDCFIRAESGGLGRATKIGSTEEMIEFARRPEASKTILIATEIGHVYTVRQAVPEKTVIPVAPEACCEFMKATTLQGLHHAVTCGVDHKIYEVTLPKELAAKAFKPIQRMLAL